MKQLLLTFFSLLQIISTQANDLPFQVGEELKFDIHYKYGLLMLKAGTANKKIIGSNIDNINSYYTSLDFKTTSFFDKIYKMRDTLSSHISENIQPIFHSRSINEGSYHFKEELFFNKFSKNYSEVRIKRESREVLKFDTILTSNNFGYDLLSVIHYVRLLDYSKMASPVNNISIFFGKKNIKLTIRNEGQSVVEKSETLKYNTYKIAVDFTDEVFNESKNAIEIWMSDDENRVPVKMRAKLSIGVAEAILVSYNNLKHPFKSEIKIPVRKN